MAELAAMLLSNLTAHSKPCNTLISMAISVTEHPSLPGGFYARDSRCATAPPPSIPTGSKSRDIPALPLLLDAFVDAAAETSQRKAKLNFLASVLANSSTVSAATGISLRHWTD